VLPLGHSRYEAQPMAIAIGDEGGVLLVCEVVEVAVNADGGGIRRPRPECCPTPRDEVRTHWDVRADVLLRSGHGEALINATSRVKLVPACHCGSARRRLKERPLR
jgi:hypothetical protein